MTSNAPPTTSGRVLKYATIAGIAAGYLYFFPYFGHLHNPNENVRVYMVLSIVNHHTFALNKTIAEYGGVDDRATNLAQRCEGRQLVEPCTYSSKAPGTSYLGVPVYLALRGTYSLIGRTLSLAATIYVLRLVCVILPSLLFLWIFGRFITQYLHGDFERYLIVATMALGTMDYTYSHVFAGHQLAAILVFSSFMLVERARRTSEEWPVLAGGFAAGYAGITEYPALIPAAVLLGYAAVRAGGRPVRSAALFTQGAVIPGLLAAFYHESCFGLPWRTGYSMLANPSYAQFHSVGVFGISSPTAAAAYAALLSPARGLFFFAPILLTGIAGLPILWRQDRRSECVVAATICLVCVMYQAAVNPDIGGWSIGPRYIVMITPFLMFGSAAFLEVVRHRSPWYLYGLVIPLCGLSIIYTFCSTVVFHSFPPVFTNPFYEWIVPLMRMDYFNYSLGTWLGARGLWSAVPGLALVAAMVARFYLGPSTSDARVRAAFASTAVLVTTIVFTALSHLQRFDSAEKDREFRRLALLWEPHRVDDQEVAIARAAAADQSNKPDAQVHLAQLLAASGEWQPAIEHYRMAADDLKREVHRRPDR